MRRGFAMLSAAALLAGCGTALHSSQPSPAPGTTPPNGPPAPTNASSLRGAGNLFAGRLLAQVARTQPTVALSPLSISQAVSMLLAGARGDTAGQIAAALAVRIPEPRLAQDWASLNRSLAAANGPGTKLDIADALYGQEGMAFRQAFLRMLADEYGAPLHTADFRQAATAARAAINAWVSTHTNGRIPQLVGPGDVTDLTRLVLVNAVYLNAKWAIPFQAANTAPAPFYAPGGTIQAAFMHENGPFRYLAAHGYQALELPYQGGRLAFDVLLPSGRLGELMRRIGAGGPLPLLAGLRPRYLAVAMPKLLLHSHFELGATLRVLGMPLAFEPGRADLSGIAGPPGDLYVQAAVHEAYVAVDEAGTEAAAATGISVAPTAIEKPPSLVVDVDRPFVFLVRDRTTGAILFIGAVSQP